jgi:hypothetical protein
MFTYKNIRVKGLKSRLGDLFSQFPLSNLTFQVPNAHFAAEASHWSLLKILCSVMSAATRRMTIAGLGTTYARWTALFVYTTCTDILTGLWSLEHKFLSSSLQS